MPAGDLLHHFIIILSETQQPQQAKGAKQKKFYVHIKCC
jgi:hypothetical protein